ncbi:DUF2333 family protein [Thiorhodococcus mannitoliphagus]|nr:DUF2333 family protein [Thiorhodococcus mannitoliphagus]
MNETTREFQKTPAQVAGRRGLGFGILIGGILLLLVMVIGGLGAYWSVQPAHLDVSEEALLRFDGEDVTLKPGVATVSAVMGVAEALLDKPGGYLSNDMLPPGLWMDNTPHWEFGVLTELRDSVGALRNDFSRSQTQSAENVDLREAESQFNFDASSWMLPSTEGEYRRGLAALQRYMNALMSGTDRSAQFHTRADNLTAYLQVVEKRLGSYAQSLSASVGDTELTAALVLQSAPSLDQTAWDQIDDIFYEARGYSWALLHTMQALAIDFADVLADKNAQRSLQQVLRDLQGASLPKWSPIVLNGHGYGLFSNHSLVMGSYISRANAAVIDLRVLLERG